MSNGDTKVNVASEGAYHLKLAMELAMHYHLQYVSQKTPTIKQWALIDGVLYCGWHESMGGQPMITPCTVDMLVPMVIALIDSDAMVFGEEPDTDGSTSKGWRLISGLREIPAHKDINSHYVQFTVQPEWMEYGK